MLALYGIVCYLSLAVPPFYITIQIDIEFIAATNKTTKRLLATHLFRVVVTGRLTLAGGFRTNLPVLSAAAVTRSSETDHDRPKQTLKVPDASMESSE